MGYGHSCLPCMCENLNGHICSYNKHEVVLRGTSLLENTHHP